MQDMGNLRPREASDSRKIIQHFGMTTQVCSLIPTTPWDWGRNLSMFLLTTGKCMGKECGEG